jgi:hypothetical protein
MVYDMSTELMANNGPSGRPPRRQTKGKTVAKAQTGNRIATKSTAKSAGSVSAKAVTKAGSKTKGSKDAVASLAAKKMPKVKGTNAVNRTKMAGPKAAKQGTMKNGGGRGSARGR